MAKTLNDAIGCWTVNTDYNSLPILANMIKKTANRCKRITLAKRSDPKKLLSELVLLHRRLESMDEITCDAIRRCKQIINTNEVETGA